MPTLASPTQTGACEPCVHVSGALDSTHAGRPPPSALPSIPYLRRGEACARAHGAEKRESGQPLRHWRLGCG
eukprot:3727211-Prymnesium_polylepis.1